MKITFFCTSLNFCGPLNNRKYMLSPHTVKGPLPLRVTFWMFIHCHRVKGCTAELVF